MIKITEKNKKYLFHIILGLLIFIAGVTALDKINSIVSSDIDKKIAIIEKYKADSEKVRPNEVNLNLLVGKVKIEENGEEYKNIVLENQKYVALNLFETFKELYPDITNYDSDFYVSNIVLSQSNAGTAEVYFGGDETILTQKMSPAEARQFIALIVFSLTNSESISQVDIKLNIPETSGTSFKPGIYTPGDFPEFQLKTNAQPGKQTNAQKPVIRGCQ